MRKMVPMLLAGLAVLVFSGCGVKRETNPASSWF